MFIGLLSDTHGSLDEQLFEFFSECDEVWHAGDIGNPMVLDALEKFKPVVAVYGNIDDHQLRVRTKEHQRLVRNGMEVWMTHIGGYPGNYDRRVWPQIISSPPGLFISGHSHILKVMHDKELGLLHINPGAAGYHGLHKVRTAVRFRIHEKRIQDLDVIELGPRSKISE